ncbi:MAG: hypothetical protein ABL977_15380 [Candidatus Eisenbacteria bacterium]
MRLGIKSLMTLVCLWAAVPARAQLRDPQVRVAGTSLQVLFSSAGQTINVAQDQRAAQSFQAVNVGIPEPLSFGVHNVRGPEWALAVYDFPAATPTLREVMPGGATPGWFSLVSFRTSPDRMVVSLFDALHSIQGSTSYLGLTSLLQGFALDAGPAGTLYSDDTRNAGQQPHMLLYRGSGAFAGDAWLCVELDGDQDFDDAVYRLEFFASTPTRRDSWSRLKQLYR